MTRRMLINGHQPEEVRVAVIDDKGRLEAYRVAVAEVGVARGNIYRGTVANIEPSLSAAFVNYGAQRHGFLSRHDVVAQAFHVSEADPAAPIEKVLKKGQPIVVQVTRDAAGTKGAALTTNISLAGRYLVLLPYEDSRGVSRKVEDEDLRRKLREKAKNLVAGDFGFIVRTNAVDQTKTDLKADLEQLKRLWLHVQQDAAHGQGPRLLYDDQDLIVQVLRDNLDAEVEEVMVDEEGLFRRAERYLHAVMPRSKVALRRWGERMPLFARFNVEPQVAAIYRRVVPLPSGGGIVLDATEALMAIDVNSGKSTEGESQQDTALKTNLEAAAEVARQLRLRDIGGLVVVDFIDMYQSRNRQRVEKALKEAMKSDRARSKVGHLSPNGLLEINRQRVGQTLHLRTHVVCPTCEGVGRLLNPDLALLGLLRRLEARAATLRVERARVFLNPRAAEVLQNRRRAELVRLENECRMTIEIVGQPGLQMSEERIEWTSREPPQDMAALPDEAAQAAKRDPTEDPGLLPASDGAAPVEEPAESPSDRGLDSAKGSVEGTDPCDGLGGSAGTGAEGASTDAPDPLAQAGGDAEETDDEAQDARDARDAHSEDEWGDGEGPRSSSGAAEARDGEGAARDSRSKRRRRRRKPRPSEPGPASQPEVPREALTAHPELPAQGPVEESSASRRRGRRRRHRPRRENGVPSPQREAAAPAPEPPAASGGPAGTADTEGARRRTRRRWRKPRSSEPPSE